MEIRIKNIILFTGGVVFFVFILSTPVFAIDEARISTTNLTPMIGEPVDLRLRVALPIGGKLILPDFAHEWSSITVQEVGILTVSEHSDKGQVVYELPLTIILWQSGALTLPPVVVSYQLGDAHSVQLLIELPSIVVMSTLDTGDLNVRPVKSQIPVVYFPWWILVSVGLPGMVGIFTLIGFRVRTKPVTSNTDSDFHPVANGVLAFIHQLNLEIESPRTIYINGITALRIYLKHLFPDISSDFTTAEITHYFRSTHLLGESRLSQLIDLLRQADTVKFTQANPKSHHAQSFIHEVISWIQSVESDRPSGL